MDVKNSLKQFKKITLENFPGTTFLNIKIKEDKIKNKCNKMNLMLVNSDSKNKKKTLGNENITLKNRQLSEGLQKEKNFSVNKSDKLLISNIKSLQNLEEKTIETKELKFEEEKRLNESSSDKIQRTDEDLKFLNTNQQILNKNNFNGSISTFSTPLLTPMPTPLPTPTPEQRAKKSKPLSMGESLLKQISNETMKKSESRARHIPKKNNLMSTNYLQTNQSKTLKNKLSSSLQRPVEQSSNPVISYELLNPLTQTKQQKFLNGIDHSIKSQAGLLNIKTCPALNVTVSSCTNSLREGSQTKFKSDNFKLNEEILEYKLSNSKLKNDINILNEKITTMKKVINMKKEENDMLRSQYSEMIDDYKKEIDRLKKINFKYKLEEDNLNGANKESKNKQNVLNSCISQSIKSTLGVLLDLLEIFISPRQNVGRQSINVENISASYSMDIYDSYNNDEERRYTMIEGIQGLLVAKLSVMKKNLHLDLEKEIERVKNWNIFRKEEANSNILNISSLKVPKINDSGDKDENDFFDLSNSKLFANQSPKFNSVELVGKASSNIENVNNYSLRKDDENQLLNDSFLKDLKQNDSFSDDKNGSLIANSNFNNPFIRIPEGEQEIMDCSIIDLETKPLKETKMLFNDDPTEFNMEYVEDTPTVKDPLNLSLNNLNTTFEDKSEEAQIPIILQPILNTKLR